MAFPKIDACIVCEGAREEILSKFILLGFFGIAPHARVAIRDFKLPVALCFVFCGGRGEGKFNVGMRVTDLQGAAIPGQSPDLINAEVKKEKPSTSVFMTFLGAVQKPGRYRVALLVNNVEHYSTTVDIDQMPAM
jgi:hypothetical protein